MNRKRIDMPPLRQTSVTFRRAPQANVEIVTRLQSIWEDSAGADDADDLEDLEDVEEEARHVPSLVTPARAPTPPFAPTVS